MPRPVLFLDIDGVVNPFDGPCPAGFTEHDLFPGEQAIRVNPDHGLWIIELMVTFDIAWASAWNEDANQLLGPLLGIPVLPGLVMPPAPFAPSAKVPLVAAHAGQRPAIWIDDIHTPEALTWRETRTAPTLLITADPAVGLTRTTVDHALAWAKAL